jgi:hypothetical protein
MLIALLFSCQHETASFKISNPSDDSQENSNESEANNNSKTDNGNFQEEEFEDNVDSECEPTNEICDGVDNDCDGLVDDEDDDVEVSSTNTYYLDQDFDGYGTEEDIIHSCQIPQGYVERGGDCDDTSEFVSPDVEEECDGIDNDCDTQIDSEEICPCHFFATETSSYFFCENTINWEEAEDHCVENGYHLLQISSNEEQQMIGENLPHLTSIWMGLNDIAQEGTWEWSNGDIISYTNWFFNEPNSFWSDEYDCSYINPNGDWGTSYCHYLSAYVCEATEK